ncbi:MAG: oxidoreductase/nitrogenase component 1 [Paenibacillaceae bacterium]|jgi:hypothetical protein|nr:oxidoreductase/nitrogenase component 1 [Paenibacillaceae bacterium]
MKKLWTRLTPFTSDTSGALGTLYDLNALGMVHDPNGCLSHYMAHDEFRRDAKAPYYVSIAQNQMDMILGNEVPLYRGFRQLIQASSPSLIAMVGTPVTALLSSDLERYAKDMEREFGIPAIAIHTTGEKLYDAGAALAYLGLCRRFVHGRNELRPKHLNLIGTTSLDLGSRETHAALEREIHGWGWNVQARLGMGSSLEGLAGAADAALSLVVSVSGLPAARYLQEHFGVPYLADLPVGQCGSARVQDKLAALASTRETDWQLSGSTEDITDAAALVAEAATKPATRTKSPDTDAVHAEANGSKASSLRQHPASSSTLIIGEQVSANALRDLVEQQTGEPADVATFFTFEASLSRMGDRALDGEAALEDLLDERGYKRIIGDPLFSRFLVKHEQDKDKLRQFPVEHIFLPHMAISGQLYASQLPLLIGADGEKLLLQTE